MTSKIFFLADGDADPFKITVTSSTPIATIQSMIKMKCPNKVASFVLAGADNMVPLEALYDQPENSTNAYQIGFDDPVSTQVPTGGSSSPDGTGSINVAVGADLLKLMTMSKIHDCTLRAAHVRNTEQKQMLSYNTEGFPILKREAIMQATYNEFNSRYTLKATPKCPVDHPSLNSLIATHAPPGGGKSTYLDMVLSRKEISLCLNPELRATLLNSVPLPVTFNSTTGTTTYEIDKNGETALCARMLFSYFFTVDSKFEVFLSFLNNYRQHLSVTTVVECIRLDCRKPILLAVDEVAVAGGRLNPLLDVCKQVVHAVGKCLNIFRGDTFNAVVSTLDVLIVGAETTFSGRPIAWIQLPRFTTSESIQLFGELSNELLVRKLMYMCNGHGRSLEHLHKVRKNNPLLFVAGTFDRVMPVLVVGMQSFNFLSMTLELIKPALFGEAVDLDSTPAGGNQAFRGYIRDGYYLNRLENEKAKYEIPVTSPLALLFYAYSCKNPAEMAIATCIAKMLTTTPGHWQSMEIFHANWEVLIREITKPDIMKNISIEEWYGGARSNVSAKGKITQKHMGVLQVHNPLPAPPYTFDQALSSDAKDKMRTNRNSTLHDAVFLYEFENANPGHDIILFEPATCIAIDTKFSKPNATTSLSIADVNHKVSCTQAAITAHNNKNTDLGELNIKEVVVVIVRFGNINLNVNVNTLPNNTIVLGLEELERLYSPSLSPMLHGW